MLILDKLNFILDRDAFELSTGRKVRIYRPGVGYYYRLQQAVLLFRLDSSNFSKIIHILEWFVDLDVLGKYPEGNTRLGTSWNALKYHFGVFFKRIQKPLTYSELFELIALVIDFNTVGEMEKPKEGTSTPTDIDKEEYQDRMEMLDSNIRSMVSRLVFRTGWTDEYILTQISNVKMHYYLWEDRQDQAVDIMNANAAFNGNSDRVEALQGRQSIM